MHTFELRLSSWIERLEKAKPCANQQEAFELLKSEWLAVCVAYDVPKQYVEAYAEGQLTEQGGWVQVEDGTYYTDCHETGRVRTYLHVDGAIVVQRMDDEQIMRILLNLPAEVSEIVPFEDA